MLALLRSPRSWCFVAGGWLVLMGLAQLGWHLWAVVFEHAMVGQREFAMNAMKQAFLLEPLQPSLWRRHRMLSVSLGLFFTFAGAMPLLLASVRAEPRVIAAFGLFGSVFWALVFLPYAFFDPVALPLATVALAVPLHGTIWLTATYEEMSGDAAAQ